MPGNKNAKGMSMSMSSMGAFLDDLAGIRSKDKTPGKKDTSPPPPPPPPDTTTPAGVSSPSTPPPPSSASTPPIKRRSSWDKSRIAITNSLRTLVSPNPKDAEAVDQKSLWPGPRLESEDPIDGDDADKAEADKSAAEAAATAAAAYQAATAASQAAAAAATSAAVQRPKRGKLRAPLSPSSRGTYETGDAPPPSPGSPLAPRTRRSLSLHSAVSESSQPETPRLSARGSVDAKGDRTQAKGVVPPSVSPSGTPGRQRAVDRSPSPSLPRIGRRGSSQGSTRKAAGTMVFDISPDAGVSRGTGSIGSSTSRSPRIGPRPQRRNSGSSGKGTAFGASYGLAGEAAAAEGAEVEGKEGATKCFSPEFVGFPSEGGGWRDGSGDAAFARRNSLPNTPSGRRNSTMAAPGPLSRLLAVSTASGSSSISGSGSGRLDGGAVPGKGDREKTTAEGRRGSGEVVAEGAGLFTRRKRTFMEKVGDMLEAAAETAIPLAPSAAAVSRHSSCRRREWDEWDAGPLLEFMSEEARTMADKGREEEVARTEGDKDKLVVLAKAWYIPFLSQGDFNRQKAALERPDVGTVDSSGRCVPVSSSRSSSSAAGARGRVSPPPPPASIPASSSRPGPSAATAEDRGRQGSGSGGGGGGSTTASGAVSGGRSAAAVGGAVAAEGVGAGGGICRAVVLGYVLDDGAVAAGGRGISGAAATIADSRRYLVEVELAPGSGAGPKRDERGPWVCYKRYSDFRTLWEGLSRHHTAMEALLRFPPLPTRRGSVFLLGAEGRAAQEKEEGELQQQLSAALEIMLSLNPRPRELVRFLRPHAVGRPAAPATAALDSARRAAAVSGSPGSRRRRGGNLSGVVAAAAAAVGTPGRGRAARGGGLRLDARRKTDARRAAAAAAATAAAAAAASIEGAGRRKEEIESPLPVTPTLRLFLGALAVLQAWAYLHAVGLTPGAFAVAAGAVWVLLAGAVIARVQLTRRRSAACAAAAAPGGRQSGAAAAGTIYPSVTGVDANPPLSPGAAGPAPTEGGGPSASTVVKGGEGAVATVTVAKEQGAIDGGDWAVRATMAGEIFALLVLMFLQADYSSSSSSGSSSEPFVSGRSLASLDHFAVAVTGVGDDAADLTRNEGYRGNLVVEVAGAVALWTARAAGVSTTALFSVAVPPLLAALATAHVARTFVVPEKASNGGSSGGSDGSSARSSPDPAAPRPSPPARAAVAVAVGPEAAAAAVAAKGKPATTLRRSSSSSSITSEARKRLPPSPAAEGRRSGAIAVSNSNKNANSRNTRTRTAYERSPSPTNDLRGGGGSGGGMPAMDLSEATLRMAVAGGGATSVFGGCWVLIRPVVVFCLRRLGMFAAAILTFPFSWAGRREASGRESSSSSSGGGSGRSPSPTPVSSSETKITQKKRNGVRGFRPAGGGDGGGGGTGSNPRHSPTTSPAEAIVAKVAVSERGSQVAKAETPTAGADSAISPEEQYDKASAAVRAFASNAKSAVSKRARRWRASVATKLGPAANRLRASIAKKIMPAVSPAGQEGQQDLAPSSGSHGDKPLPSPTSVSSPVLATAAASFQLPRPSPGAALPASAHPDLAGNAAEQLGDAAGLEWKAIRGGWCRGHGEEVQQLQQHVPLGTWTEGGDDWLGAVDCAVAAVYASGPQMKGFPHGDGDGGVYWRRHGGEDSGVLWSIDADDGAMGNGMRPGRVADSGGGSGSGGVVFVSTAQVVLLWAVVIFLGVTLRREYRLARGRRWEALAVLVMAKTFVTAFVIAAFSLLLWEGSGPAWMLCAVEVCRCVALLSLIFAAVQAGIQPEGKALGDGRDGRALLRRRTKPRLADDPTTPRGEHLANPAAHALAWAGRNGGGGGGGGGASGNRLADAVPTAPMSESRTRASSGSYSERARRPLGPALGGGRALAGVGGGGTWFSGDSQYSSDDENISGGEEGVAMATAVAKAKRQHHPSSGSTSISNKNNRSSGGGGSNSNLSRFLSELSTSFHGGGSSGGIRAPRRRKATGQHRTSGRNDRSSSVSAGARTSGTAGRAANIAGGEGGGGRGTIRPPGLVGEVKPEAWVWGAGDAE